MITSNNKKNNRKSKENRYSKYSWSQNINYYVQEEDYIDLNKEDNNSIKVFEVEYSGDNIQTNNYRKLVENKKYQDYTEKKARKEPLELSWNNEKDFTFKNSNKVKIIGTKFSINVEDSSNNEKGDINNDEPTNPLIQTKNEKMFNKKPKKFIPTILI